MISLASTAIYGLLKPFPTGGVGTADPKPWTSNEIDSSDGLRELAFKLNPAVGYWCAKRNHRICPLLAQRPLAWQPLPCVTSEL